VIWLTGLSGSGKTTLASAVQRLLGPSCPELVVLDGDVVRAAFGGDLGYTEADRVVQVSRVQRMAKLLADQGQVVIVAVVYSNPDLLTWNRKNLPGYFEIHMKASLDTVVERDSKGLYEAARRGETTDVVGVDIAWQDPVSSDLVINSDRPEDPDGLAQRVIAAIPRLSQSHREN
jgi:cytidine diphosphoramidate kinase